MDKRPKIQLLYTGLLLAVLLLAIPQISYFKESWHILAETQWLYVVFAVGALLASYIAATCNYLVLAFHKLRFGPALLVQLAASAINRVLPSGIGGLGVTYMYLHKNQHTNAQALAALSVNNGAGLAGHGLLVAIVLIADVHARQLVHVPTIPLRSLLLAIFVMLVVVVGMMVVLKSRMHAFIRSFKIQARFYEQHLHKIGLVLLSSMVLTLCYALMTKWSLQAVGSDLGLGACIVILASRTIGIAAVPTPSGLGGAEAAAVAAMVAYGVPASAAFAAALVMRLVTYMVSFGPGLVSAVAVKRMHLV